MRMRRIASQAVVVALSFLFAVQGARADPDQGPKGVAARVAALEAAVSALQAQVAALQGASVLGQYVSVDPNPVNGLKGPHVFFTGVNVHVRSGSGSTDDAGALTGLGNLVIGYNEPDPNAAADRNGSHNLIVGPRHEYSSFGGFVAGDANDVLGPSSSVSGGSTNTASGGTSSVSGGNLNTASGFVSSVSGGGQNTANGVGSSVSGGGGNIASGFFTSVSGGEQNKATGVSSSVSGGSHNWAIGDRSSVSGGRNREAPGHEDWAAGEFFSDDTADLQ